MSDAPTAPAPFTDAEKTDIRRFCGYPAYGTGAGSSASWRFFESYGQLEFRLDNLQPAELTVVRGYLAQLQLLESAIVAAASNLGTAQAAIWTRNPTEVRDRQRLFDDWRRRLCGFLGVPPGNALGDCGIRIIV